MNLFGVKFFKYNHEDYVIGGASSGFVEILKRGEDNRIRAFKVIIFLNSSSHFTNSYIAHPNIES